MPSMVGCRGCTLMLLLVLSLGVSEISSFTSTPSSGISEKSSMVLFASAQKKDLSASQQERREEDKRRQERKSDVVIGKTSAVHGERDFALDPKSTEKQWMNQAGQLEKEIHLRTEDGMKNLRQLDLEEATKSFERVFELKPNAYLWQAGIAYYYLGNLKRASEIFAQSAKYFESRFGEIASEERIWRCACELRYLSGLNKDQQNYLEEQGTMAEHISPMYSRDPDSEPLERETRKVMRITNDLFESSTNDDYIATTLARAKLRSIGGKPSRSDLKMWKLNSWYYLGLHYDALGEVDDSKQCMKMALRLCPNGSGANDLMYTLPFLHMSSRDWFDDDEFEELDASSTTSTVDVSDVKVPAGIKADPLLVQSIRDSISKMKLDQLKDAMKARGLSRHGSKEILGERLFRVLLEDVGLEI